ncbi:MAG: hypothetical protein KDD43_16045, partial [Bdellovibrionales bacterium]|nr:hypothetical protein [Bdellovibrionales bacterium]
MEEEAVEEEAPLEEQFPPSQALRIPHREMAIKSAAPMRESRPPREDEEEDQEEIPKMVRPMMKSKSAQPMKMKSKSAVPIESKSDDEVESEPRYRYEIRNIIREVERLDREQQEFVMKQLGIKPIWYTDYEEIPELLKKIIG